MTTLGKRIAKIREARGLKQENVAEILKITTNSYAKIERDESDISLSRLGEIAKALEVDIKTFFEEKNPIIILGDVRENAQINGKNGKQYNHTIKFDKERQSYQNHITDLQKQLEVLQKNNENLQKIIDKLVDK